MSTSQKTDRVVILVKALPRPSKKYAETVCCAGINLAGQWKRLYPVRFRHLNGAAAFKRWDFVRFRYGKPKQDARSESCHVHEETLAVDGALPKAERARFLNPIIQPSTSAAARLGLSLALIRPLNSRFVWKEKSPTEIQTERESYKLAASQGSLLDDQLTALEPTPYHLRFMFEDSEGKRHSCTCGDWEAHAMFWNFARRKSIPEALADMGAVFNEQYPERGMVFAMGNLAKRPQTWQLLGVIRLDVPSSQGELF